MIYVFPYSQKHKKVNKFEKFSQKGVKNEKEFKNIYRRY